MEQTVFFYMEKVHECGKIENSYECPYWPMMHTFNFELVEFTRSIILFRDGQLSKELLIIKVTSLA